MEYILIEEVREDKVRVDYGFSLKRLKKSEICDDLNTVEAYIIEGKSEDFFEEACRDIRNLSVPEHYLIPIVFLTESELSHRVASMADAVVDLDKFDGSLPEPDLKKIDSINDAIRRMDPTAEGEREDRFLRVLRFIFSRNKKIFPVRDWTSFFGLSYPQLEPFFPKNDHQLFGTLDFLEENGSIEGNFFENVHFCNRCYCAFLNFIEVCPNCGSADLVEENLIHHFPCAYVGPESDYMKDGLLICPKCDKKLESLGVDYDKPAVVYTCNQCGFVAQEPDVKTVCNHCGKETSPDDLILQTIKVYALSSLGENFAIYGFESPLLKSLREQLNILPYKLFMTLVQIESERSKRYGVESSLLAFNITNLNNIYLKLGKNIDRLLKEIGALILIMMETRKCDVLTVLNEGTILLLLPHTPRNGAKVVENRLISDIQKLIKENVGIEPVIKSSILEISRKNFKEADKLIKELLGKLKQDQE